LSTSWGALAAGRDLEDARVKSEIAGQCLPLIEDLPNPVERDTYRQRLARFLKVDERSLVGVQTGGPKIRRPRPRAETPARVQEVPATPVAAAISPSRRIEAHILGLLCLRPDLLYRLDRLLQEAGLGRMTPKISGILTIRYSSGWFTSRLTRMPKTLTSTFIRTCHQHWRTWRMR